MQKNNNKQILVIDETLREGMQYRGVMFSIEQRLKILEFQETLGVDICQAGYPSAHELESQTVTAVLAHALEKKYQIRVAAMGRATLFDAKILLSSGVNDLHFHVHIKNGLSKNELKRIFDGLLETAAFVKKQNPNAAISIAMLDIGKSDQTILDQSVTTLNHPDIDILSLPDTSGMMAPNQVFEKISILANMAANTKISVHCHNDMGMASANSVMGILAGGRVLEACVLGIGERNGLADLFTTARHLKDQGFEMRLNTDDLQTFKAYYDYVDTIVHEQTNIHLMTANTPVFGDAVKTHVAGTHASGEYGLASEEHFYLNILCGKHLVKKYLEHHNIIQHNKNYPDGLLDILTTKIKSESFRLNRCLSREDIKMLLSSLQK